MIKRSNTLFQEGDSLFLEMKLLKLELSTPIGTPVKICVYKGLQKLDETCYFNINSEKEFVIDQSILNFHIRDFQKKKNVTFKITLETEKKDEEELGSFDIRVNNFIVTYIKDGVNTFQRDDYLTESIQLEYMLFMEKTKADVEKSLRSYQASRKSIHYPDNGNQWTITSPAYSQKQSRIITGTKIQNSEQIQRHGTPHSKKFNKTPLFKTSEQQNDRNSNKVWFEMQDGQQIVNNLVHRPPLVPISRPTIAQSPATLNLKIVGGLTVLGVIAYLIMLLDDMNYGMDLVRNIIQTQIRQNYL